MKSFNFNVSYATQQGSSHKLNNIACEDCVQIVKTNNFSFFGLCDGAGSAENSLLGAEYILEALCNELQSNTQKYFEDKDSSSLLTE